ncbi:MAG: hypothetical protein IKP65_08910, partial [Alphaproteobacteria bacterium]|nr:hypothetical protein [Alphaproteobacteria bacterium]
MSFNLENLLVSNLSDPYYWGLIFVLIALAVITVVFMSDRVNMFLPKPFDTRLVNYLPFERILNDKKTILCQNGTLVRVFKVNGASIAFAKREVIQEFLEDRKKWIDSLSEISVETRIFTIREKIHSEKVDNNYNKLLKDISEKWNEAQNEIFMNTHYIVISVNDRKDAMKDLETASSNLKAILSNFGAEMLKEDGKSESPISFFAHIINPISRPNPRSQNIIYDRISELLVSDEIFFSNKGYIRFTSGNRTKYMAVVGIKQQSNIVDEQMLSDILAKNFEITVLHNLFPISKLKAQMVLVNQRKMASSTTFSYDVLRQFDDALALIEQGDEDHQTLVNYAETFFVSADSLEELDKAVFEIEKVCRLYGIVPVREGWVAQASWFSQFPTYDKYPRMYKMLSRAVATSFNFEKQPEGLSKCDWG